MNLIPTPHHRGCVWTLPSVRWIAYMMFMGVLALDSVWIMDRTVDLISQVDSRAAFAQAVTDPATWWPAIVFGLGGGVPLLCIAFGLYLLERAGIISAQ
jgi:hypothetical protein